MVNWKTINGYEGYEVSSEGQVRNVKTGRILKSWSNRLGYEQIWLCKNGKSKFCLAHRLVAEAFIPNPQNLPCVNHKDENRANNNVDNLEWCDHKYNNNYGAHGKKISAANKGNQNFKGHRHSEATKLKMSKALKGRTFSEESIQKMRDSHKRNKI